MKNSLKKTFITFFSICCLVVGSLAGLFSALKSSKLFVSQETYAEHSSATASTSTGVSIFIREPTYSFSLGGKIFFIDDADKLLKSYKLATETESGGFESNYLNLGQYEILDVCLCGNDLFMLVNTNDNNFNSVIKVTLNDDLDEEAINLKLEQCYDRFCVSSTQFDSVNYLFFTFTCSNTSLEKNCSFTLFNCSTSEFLVDASSETSEIEPKPISFSGSFVDYTKNILKATLFSTSTQNYIFFLYENAVIYYKINALSDLVNLSTISEIGTFEVENFSLENETIIKSCFLNVGDTTYLSSFYLKTNGNETTEIIKVFSISFSSVSDPSSENELTKVLEVDCTNLKFASICGDCLSFSNSNLQTIYHAKFSLSPTGTLQLGSTKNINNPDYRLQFLTANEFIYKNVNTNTELFDNPWGAYSDVEIEQNSNIIKIGFAQLTDAGQTQICDYDYCMFTNSSGNHFGFVKNEYLDTLPEKTLKDAGYKVIKDENGIEHAKVSIWPNSSLYSLPTTFCSGTIGVSELVAERVMQIEDNSLIEILDVLGEYQANNVKMLKVKVNDNQIGYIEARCIRTPADIVNFIVTNATIKNDNTKVYLSANSDATILPFTLNSGKNVRINGKRDTKTGFTSITFNDEFGNEFSGYIETDYVKADAWSTLQIVGCVLIAINIGLLILILIFKKNHLGSHGQKVAEEELITKK